MTPQPEEAARSWPQRAGRLAALALLGLFFALLVYGLVTKSADPSIDTSLAEAKAPLAPPFELALLHKGDGPKPRGVNRAAAAGKVSAADLRGAPVVLNFWASWCPPCREEAPRLEAAWRRARQRGVLVLGLDMQDVTDDARAFISEYGLSYPNLRDPGDDVARDYGVTGLPETFFISPRGRIVGHVVGAISARQLAEGIAAARSGQPRVMGQGGARQLTR